MAQTRSKIFVDTGGWYSFIGEDERWHSVAVEYYVAALAAGDLPVTSDYVIDETLTRLRYDFGHAVAMTFWRIISQARGKNLLRVLRVDEVVWREAMEIFEKYSDQDFSFTDCTSFVLARRENIEDVFTFDHHFSMFGFNVRPVV